MKRDYYEILGVAKTTTVTEIKKAYRSLAMQFHPDRNPGNNEAEEKFKEASEAYEVLSNEEQRQIYDQFGHQGLQGHGFQGFSGVDDVFDTFGDIFEEFFGFSGGGGRGRSGGGRAQRARRGHDLRYDLEVEFEEACFGIEKKVNITKHVPCEDCKGSGARSGTILTACAQCKGAGQVRHTQGFFTISTTCPSCQGSGSTIPDPCPACKGQGAVQATKKLSVKIPPGVDDGIRLLMQGEGEAGERGGPPGDLYVLVHVKKHESFIRDGVNILTEFKISMIQAALGEKLQVPTLHGEKDIEIPRGIQTGEKITIKGMGVPHLRSKKPGDHILVVNVQTPVHLSKEQEECLKQFAALSEKPKNHDKKKKGLFG